MARRVKSSRSYRETFGSPTPATPNPQQATANMSVPRRRSRVELSGVPV
jgi:hypothetical protein